MADIARSAKSGDAWTSNDLAAYNIQLVYQDTQTFFGEGPLPAPPVHEEVLTAITPDIAVDDDTRNLLGYLDILVECGGEQGISQFLSWLFMANGYAQWPRHPRVRKALQLAICGEHVVGRHEMCVIDYHSRDVLLLVCHDKRTARGTDAHAQLFSGAIAAFQCNNARRQADGLDPLDNKIVPGIIIAGTCPTFFKIPVTRELAQCVEHGQYSPTPTVVLGHIPDIPSPKVRQTQGMMPLDNRRAFLQCFEAFKKYIV